MDYAKRPDEILDEWDVQDVLEFFAFQRLQQKELEGG